MWSDAHEFIIQIRELDEVKKTVGLPVRAKVAMKEGKVDDF